MFNFDLHVATEICSKETARQGLLDLGLVDDELVNRHVSFYEQIAMSACPLIGMHLTKKYPELTPAQARPIIESDMNRIAAIFKEHSVVGYAHAEIMAKAHDMTLKSNRGFTANVPWPVARFKPVFSETNKQWDIHIAIPLDELPEKLATILESSGMYSIDLLKQRDGRGRRFRVYTIQSISPGAEGKALYRTLVEWFRASSAPHIEIKLEHYLAMIRSGKPAIVPPTIDRVEYSHIQSFSSIQYV